MDFAKENDLAAIGRAAKCLLHIKIKIDNSPPFPSVIHPVYNSPVIMLNVSDDAVMLDITKEADLDRANKLMEENIDKITDADIYRFIIQPPYQLYLSRFKDI